MPFTPNDVLRMKELVDVERRGDDAKWAQADLALSLNLSSSEKESFAAQAGLSKGVLAERISTAKAWPPSKRRKDRSYTLHRDLRNDPDRFGLIKHYVDVNDMREATGQAAANSRRSLSDPRHPASPQSIAARATAEPAFMGQILDQLPAETRGQLVREALASPEVAREVASDVSARAAVARAENEVLREARHQRDLSPAEKASRQTVAGDDVIRRIVSARFNVTQALDQAMDDGLTPAKRIEAQEALAELATSIGWFQHYLETGDTSFEDELDALLRQEQ